MRMPLPATPSAEVRDDFATPPAAGDPAVGTWRTLGRHQLGAIAATLVDFATMIALVELTGLSPEAATPVGAVLGAVTNFTLGRAWIFRRHTGHWAAQASRYALVSAASAGWNTVGEQLMHGVGHVQYVAARAIVSFVVSLLWNFPMQRAFVFRERRA
jgi:putative flippase GtrA